MNGDTNEFARTGVVLELQEVFNSSLMTLAAVHTPSDEQQVHKCVSVACYHVVAHFLNNITLIFS